MPYKGLRLAVDLAKPETNYLNRQFKGIVMLTPVWELLSWPTVWSGTEDHTGIASRLRHLSTSVCQERTDDGCVIGQVLFGLESGAERFGIAWDWVALGGRVLAIADPMAIVSNLHFVGGDGRAVAESERILELNNVVNSVPWQRRVCRALPSDAARRSKRAVTSATRATEARAPQTQIAFS